MKANETNPPWLKSSEYTVDDKHVYNGADKVVLYWYEDSVRMQRRIRFYSDRSMQSEVFGMQAQSNLGSPYSVYDSVSGRRIGLLNQGRLKSALLGDFWEICDAGGHRIGTLREDSASRTWFRRLFRVVTRIPLPETRHLRVGHQRVARYASRKIGYKLDVTLSPNIDQSLDRRLVIAAAPLIKWRSATKGVGG